MADLTIGWQAIEDAQLGWWPNFLPVHQADRLMADIQKTVALQSGQVKVFGKHHTIPRLQAWFGPYAYRYSGETLPPNPIPDLLLPIMHQCQVLSGSQFNSVLLNYYRDGRDHMGWHSDNEPELGEQPIIASVSLGAERDFDLRHRATNQRLRVPLTHGSLLVMAGDCQHKWQHALPKRLRERQPRLNLTFRFVTSH
ncbi:alpha-ketoglutarate-dependent dioxygenase AlkB [Neiella marina]|uniref:Alpha-ketoglutarate-dependent dioxygenase AlkB n=1 Tax=Neiella holothuriorum TaxID=2870530 RepID=A0ABS7EHS5_9GAMM|nr:alpha-ketoglutarate-dependent dioxygenase AlkB [Neiella holothuriorum]MBW8191789.1 alpha-ketoglutarate-dependent dioxygenase AlkB [Neiella holothuriorum]